MCIATYFVRARAHFVSPVRVPINMSGHWSHCQRQATPFEREHVASRTLVTRTERAACSSVPAAQAQHPEACCTSAPLQRPLSAQPSEPSNKQLLFSGVKRCNPVPAAHQANCAALPKGGAMESRMAQSLPSCSGRPPCSAHQPPVYRILMLSRSRRRRQFLPTTAVVTLCVAHQS